MSAKNLDGQGRWRSVNVSFRVSPDEDQLLETFVKLSGMTKQDYIASRLLCKDVVIQGNPRVYKALRDKFEEVIEELKRIEKGGDVRPELLETIEFMAVIMNGMKEDTNEF
ncbi:MAG: hypothetical protein IKB22_00600 [Lentisphaeria bacterium]|nr:hypothetical protein [Lentisphaeria bacterium]